VVGKVNFLEELEENEPGWKKVLAGSVMRKRTIEA
jgi:hypothetical protein